MKNRILSMSPEAQETSVVLDLPEPYSHEYFPRYDATGRVMVLGASAGGHEHDSADYEVFLWKAGTPSGDAIRLTWHTGNDCWPDVYLE
jgi:hypothetical protein